jgi:hypothetical protein
MVANGAAVGIVAALIGAAAGFVAWFSYVPSLRHPSRRGDRDSWRPGLGACQPVRHLW